MSGACDYCRDRTVWPCPACSPRPSAGAATEVTDRDLVSPSPSLAGPAPGPGESASGEGPASPAPPPQGPTSDAAAEGADLDSESLAEPSTGPLAHLEDLLQAGLDRSASIEGRVQAALGRLEQLAAWGPTLGEILRLVGQRGGEAGIVAAWLRAEGAREGGPARSLGEAWACRIEAGEHWGRR